MRIINDFTEEEKKKAIEDFYNSFATGFDFENFLKPFLESLGLVEVFVTKKTGDDGIDLTAKRVGLAEFSENDMVNYRIQAKRTKPDKTISPDKIDSLRGNLLFNEKGIFITTGRVSTNAKEKALTKDPSKPVIVIDGSDLIDICIQKQIGFAYRPVFSSEALKEFSSKGTSAQVNITKEVNGLEKVSKLITFNDIRAHIISIPSAIVEKMDKNTEKHNLKVNVNGKEYSVTYSPGRNMFSSVTAILKDFGLRNDDGSFIPKQAEWSIDDNNSIYIEIENKH